MDVGIYEASSEKNLAQTAGMRTFMQNRSGNIRRAKRSTGFIPYFLPATWSGVKKKWLPLAEHLARFVKISETRDG